MKNITILWWFWCWNLWDDTILLNEINLIKEVYKTSEITVLSCNPKLISKVFSVKSLKLPPISWYRFYKFLNIFYLFSFLKTIKSTDIFILWWWWFFSDRQFFAVSWWLRYCRVAKYFWAKVIWFWMWAWPFFHDSNRNKIKKVSNVFDYISVRDNKSLENLFLTWFDKNKLIKTIDPAFFTSKIKVKKENSIWFILKSDEEYFIKEIKNILQNTHYNIKLIISDYLDISLNYYILNEIQSKRLSIHVCENPYNLIKKIYSCDFIISQRLHWSIISFTQWIPFLNIYYHHKWKELIDLLKIDDFSIDNKNINNYKLLKFINKMYFFNFIQLDLDNYKKTYLWKIN